MPLPAAGWSSSALGASTASGGLSRRSPAYNRRSGLAIMCPITSHIKGYPFEVELPRGLNISGAVLADHVKSLDWRIRRAEHAGKVPTSTLQEVQARLAPLLGL
ncbi:MAG: type II toxin-antitoxin system PemK/MazF family toxin [Acidobacteriia bacterium]|nr:type II toxin-antitoxin system PemK/MazF family toxin [Terriglobia bacterium]